MRKTHLAGALAAIGAGAIAFGACSRDETPSRESTPAEETTEGVSGRDGDLTIGPAFSGAELEGVADGRRDLSELAPECRGLTLEQGWSHVLTLTEPAPLTLSATPRGVGVADLMIAVRAPDGTWTCADDATDLDPVMARLFVAGEHRMLVGTANTAIVPYTLTIAPGLSAPDPIELGGRFPAPVVEGTAPTRTTEGTFGGLEIPASTGQAVLTGRAGGTRDAGAIDPECNGAIAQTPDHVLDVRAAQELMLRVRSDEDTTLVVQGPGGLVLCSDDADGLNPVVRAPFEPGFYSVYVGAYDADAAPSYSLSVSR